MSLRLLGPPKIPVNPMTADEEIFAKLHNAVDYKEVCDMIALDTARDSTAAGENEVMCSSCFFMSMEDSPDTLRDIRRLRLEQECGLDTNYRCVKCRDCKGC